MQLPSDPATRLAAFLALAGSGHLLLPRWFDPMVPDPLPGPARAWTHGSGLAEMAVGAAVAHPRTRPLGALAAAGLFVAVLPGNVKTVTTAPNATLRALACARLPLQVPLVAWALRVRRTSA